MRSINQLDSISKDWSISDHLYRQFAHSINRNLETVRLDLSKVTVIDCRFLEEHGFDLDIIDLETKHSEVKI